MRDDTPLLVVSTCGTSTLSNTAEGDALLLLRRTANQGEQALSTDDRAVIDAVAGQARKRLQGSDRAAARVASAELNALLGLDESEGRRRGRPDLHYLVATDTYQGGLAAEVLAEALPRLWPNSAANVHCEPGLNTSSAEGFSAAMSGLGRWIDDLVGQLDGYRVVFNPTGGFKGVLGMLQTFGMFYADETVYLFEGKGAPLLRIPRLPVRLDAGAVMLEHRELFRRLAVYSAVPVDELGSLRHSTLVLVVDDEATLSAWGELLWRQTRAEAYGDALLPPLSEAVRYGDRFAKEAARLPADRLVVLNGRIDDLSRYLDGGRRAMPRSLSYKLLQGDPVSGSSHELYAWSDGGAARVFCHEEDGTVVLDTLGAHL